MSKEKPDWLQPTREFCEGAGIDICGWGSDTLLVKAESRDRATQVASQLRPLGFEPIEDEDDAQAGMLLLSRDRVSTRSKQMESLASADVSRRPRVQRVGSLFEVAFSVWCIWQSTLNPKYWVFVALGSMLLWDAVRILGWKLEMSPQELRIRRYFLWNTIPWRQIRSVEVGPTWGRGQEAVKLTLESRTPLNLGAFGYAFACLLRDRLRNEVTQRRGEPQ
jgi:membrane protein YdbS with pleckstrin-like domain